MVPLERDGMLGKEKSVISYHQTIFQVTKNLPYLTHQTAKSASHPVLNPLAALPTP